MNTTSTGSRVRLAVLGDRQETQIFDDSVGHLHFDRAARAWRTPAEVRALNAPDRRPVDGDVRCA